MSTIPDPASTPEQFTPPLDESEKRAAQNAGLKDAGKAYIAEARDKAREWQLKSIKCWDMIHGRINWSHKKPEQSKIHINRVGLAQEQIKAQIKQGLVNFDQWCVVEDNPGFESPLMSTSEAKRLVLRLISDTDPRSAISENVGIAAVENMLATKLQPVVDIKRLPGGKTIERLRVEHIPLNVFSYYSSGEKSNKLYEIHELEMPKFRVVELASDNPDKQHPYKLSVAKSLSPMHRLEELREDQTKGNDILSYKLARRQNVVIHEIWGTILDEHGEIMEWEREDGSILKLKDVFFTMANEEHILGEPQPFPTWDGESYFISTQLLHTHVNTYGRSLLMPGVDMNRAEDELVSALVDSGLKEGYNINILKVHGLADKSQASGGLKYGTTLLQNEVLAPNEKLVDTVTTGQVPQGLIEVTNMIKSAGAENMRLNEISLSGQMPTKQVRATEVASTNNTIQGLFEAIVSDLEEIYIEAYARKIFLIGLQFASFLDDNDLSYIFYGHDGTNGTENRVAAFKAALKNPKKLYDELAYSFRFRGKGVRSIAQNMAVSQALVNVFSMIVSNPMIGEMFQRRGLDITKMFDAVLKGFKIDIEDYLDPATAIFAAQRQLIQEQATQQGAAMQQAMQGANQQGGGGQQQGPSAPAMANGMQQGVMTGQQGGQ